jgi:predicted dehydrogenase
MTESNNSRRDFLKTATLGAAGLALSSRADSYARIQGANNRVRVGLVGFSDRCRSSLVPAFMANAKDMNFDVVAVSDIWSRRRDEGAETLAKLTGHEIAKARNNDELFERKDVDAVIIATPDFQHALHGVDAVRAGRDAYIEKPMANAMEDAKTLRKAVEETKKVVQIGSQRRSGANYIRANEFIRSGKFGDIVMVEMTWNVNQPGRWRRAQLVKEIRQQDTDWDRFLLNRRENGRKADWDPRKYLEFRLFWPYSSGIPCQWMSHQIDTVHWFSGLPHPRSVVVNGGNYEWRDGRKNFDTMTAVFDYGPLNDPSKGFQVVYSSRFSNSAGGVKEYYYSNAGMLNLDTNKITSEGGLRAKEAAEMQMRPNLLAEVSLTDATPAAPANTNANTGVDSLTSAHMRNWMECVRSRETPHASVEAGYNHSTAICMTIAAMHSGQRVTFDDVKQEVVVGK